MLLISGVDAFTSEAGVPLAYDLSCPYERKPDIRVRMVADGILPMAVCPECGSKYDVTESGGFRRDYEKMLRERIDRMNALVEKSNPLSSDNDTLDRAMSWIVLTTDELVTCQQGNGIYAGLPWFNEYWGQIGRASCRERV